MKKSFVAAIGGYSGSGKSTVVMELAKMLPSSVTLFFDDYASRRDFPEDRPKRTGGAKAGKFIFT